MEIATLDRYQLEALRTAGSFEKEEERLVILGLGLAGESGEVVDLIKKIVGHKHPVTPDINDKMVTELGDVLWYVANLAESAGYSLSQVATRNIDKLKRRYPDGFTPERSINREEQLTLGL